MALPRAEGVAISPRPSRSTLALDKLESTGFTPRDGAEALTARARGEGFAETRIVGRVAHGPAGVTVRA